MVHHVADSKGKIEAGIKYVQSNALQGRVFDTLAAQNTHLAHWEGRVADLRIHGTTKRQVGQVFEEIERPALLPLPAERFPFFHEAQRIVHRDGHVEVDIRSNLQSSGIARNESNPTSIDERAQVLARACQSDRAS